MVCHSHVLKNILLLATKEKKTLESVVFINTGAFIYVVLILVSQQTTSVSTSPHRQQ